MLLFFFFFFFALSTLIYYQVFVGIVCSILTIDTPQDNQCWWVWAAFALKMKPLPHTFEKWRTNHNQNLFSLPFPVYPLFFWRLIVTFPSISRSFSQSSPDNTFTHPQNSENLHATLFHVMTVHSDCKFYSIAFVFFGGGAWWMWSLLYGKEFNEKVKLQQQASE